jgi:16S rRNA (uracil1498-N3)-methyltransferase
MARELRRLLMAPPQLAAAVDGVLTLSSEHSRYLTRVLRYGPGAHFAVVDGIGHLWEAELLARDQARLLQPLDQPLQRQPAPRPQLVLAASVVKRDFDLVVRMAVELGVDRLVPLLCERTAVLGQLREERWHTIAAEAAEQCERLWMPRIDPPTALKELLSEAQGGSRLWATTRNNLLPSPVSALADYRSGDVWLACGPEGGWSDAEEREAAQAGWIAVQFGSTILRSSTACVAGLSLISSWRSAR